MSDPEHSNATQLAGTGAANLYAVIDKDKLGSIFHNLIEGDADDPRHTEFMD
jgi:hypothetical protein